MGHGQVNAWAQAKVAAGLAAIDEVAKRNLQNAESFRDEELLQALVDVASSLGHLPGCQEYRAGRAAELDRPRRSNP
jgi:hypothetical protein